MNWTCRFSKEAAKQLRRLPRDRKEQIAEAISEMALNPAGGDVRRIKNGRFQGALRRRVGDYRIVFSLDSVERVVQVAAILPRAEKTCR